MLISQLNLSLAAVKSATDMLHCEEVSEQASISLKIVFNLASV